MIKAFILLFNLLGILFSWLFFPGTVSVTQTAPSSAQINNSLLVQVTINKGDLGGQGMFTEQLPPGFKAVTIDDQGAQTNFDGSTVSFSWASLPSDGIMDISFRVDITPQAAVQSYALVGKFTYTVNGQSSEADCAPTNITITNSPVVQSSTPQTPPPSQNMGAVQPINPQNTSAVQSSTPQASSTSSSSLQASNAPRGSGSVFVVRSFSSTSISPKNDAIVTLTIHKANITGFAKIEDSIPPGFTASASDLNRASFTFVDTRAKFVWDNIPPDSVVTISYHIATASSDPGTHLVVGNFSYLLNNNPTSISIGSSTFNSSAIAGYDINKEKNASHPPVTSTSTDVSSANTVAVISPPNANSSTINTSTTAVASNPPVVDAANQVAATTTASQPDASQPSTSASSSDVTYKVQILALRNPVNSSYFSGRKIKEHVATESGDGLTKYTVGNYTDYKLVKEARDNLRKRGFDGAFVVTYKSGVRLSLEDAMKINH